MSETYKKKDIGKNILIYLFMIVLGFFYALNYQLFVVKNAFAPNGVSGIGAMIEYKTGFSNGYFFLIVNIPLCVLAFFSINKEFAANTLFFSLAYSASLILFRFADLSAFQYDAQGVDTIFPALIAGSVSGFIYGLAFRRNSSTGGSDIIAKYISKKRPSWNFFWINFALNAAIAVASYFVYAVPDETGALVYNYKPVCLCMLYCFLSSLVGNSIIRGSKSALKFTVITSHADVIKDEIFNKLKHGATCFNAVGAYSNSSKQAIVCVINKRQQVDFENILKKYDDTFTFVETVSETIGNFTHIK